VKGLDRLTTIRGQSLAYGLIWKHKDLFRILWKEDVWIMAYKKILKCKKAFALLVPKRITLDCSVSWLKQLQGMVISEAYNPSSIRQSEIPKVSIGDRIVLEVIQMVLEAIFEPLFCIENFGGKTNLGPHSVLEYIEKKYRHCDWILQGCIEAKSHFIDSTILCNILTRYIEDPRFINLIRKMMHVGITYEKTSIHSLTGISQHGIMLPILVNIYLHEVDIWIQSKRHQYMINQSRTSIRLVRKVNQLSLQVVSSELYRKILREIQELRVKQWENRNRLTKTLTNIHYVRYLNSWIIGVEGDFIFGPQFKEEIRQLLNEKLKVLLSFIKMSITHLRKGYLTFLGYEIYLPRTHFICHSNTISSINHTNFIFDIPLKTTLKLLEELGYITFIESGIRPISKLNYVVFEDHLVINHYKSIWFSISQYYLSATSSGRLQYIHYLLHTSCAMTLAHRHRTSSKVIFTIRGKLLQCLLPMSSRCIHFPLKIWWSWEDRRWLRNLKSRDPFKSIRSHFL
jgi:retron-type reverse transcriptase